MNIDHVFATSAAGLSLQRLRMEAAAHNLEIANVAIAAGTNKFLDAVAVGFVHGKPEASIKQEAVQLKKVHDPGNPMADSNGDVSYPDINKVAEMTQLITASRGYESNVRALNILNAMIQKSLSIGAK